MVSGLGIFGSGWLLAWQILTIIAYLPMVVLPAAIQSKESLELGREHGPLSLGTFGVVSSVALYFFAIALVNGVLVARAVGAHWTVAALLGLAAACGLCVTSGMLMYQMADIGGRAWVIGAWVVLIALLLMNLGGPRWAASGGPATLPSGLPETQF